MSGLVVLASALAAAIFVGAGFTAVRESMRRQRRRRQVGRRARR